MFLREAYIMHHEPVFSGFSGKKTQAGRETYLVSRPWVFISNKAHLQCTIPQDQDALPLCPRATILSPKKCISGDQHQLVALRGCS